ncbi:MAG TPA: TonB-dependent receptor [Novosphingobium sp.]|nr:TonB-dependent receptor [Novosphingobium sp.]
MKHDLWKCVNAVRSACRLSSGRVEKGWLIASGGLIGLGSGLSLAHPALAQEATAAREDIIVTGTRDPGQTARQSISPITVLGTAQLRDTGQADLRDTLQQLVPSITRPLIGASPAAMVDAFSLRGLTSDQTLVLVNGKRRHTSSALFYAPGPQQGTTPVDIDMIPLGAIQRVEILQDGAAAQYGSDAIAGVVNIILKNDHKGVHLQSTNGGYYAGDGFTSQESANVGLGLGANGFLDLSADFRYQDHTIRSGPDSRTGLKDNPSLSSPRQTRETVGYNLGYDLGPDTSLYSFGTYGHRVADAYQLRRLPTVAPTIYPGGFVPIMRNYEDDYAITAGVSQKNLVGWNLDFSTTFGRNILNEDLLNTVNTTLLANTGSSPTHFRQMSYKNSQWTNNLDLRRAIPLSFLAAPLNIALGGEFRRETYDLGAGEPGSYYGTGPQGQRGLSPDLAGHSARSVEAAYAELSTRLTPAWQVDLAGRFEHYSDAGNTTTGKISSRYDITPRLALRGTFSNGFRAPSLAQENFSNFATTPTAIQGLVKVNSVAGALLGARPLKPERSQNISFGAVASPIDGLHLSLDAYQIRVKDRIVAAGVYNGAAAIAAFNAAGITIPSGISASAVSVQYFANAADTRTRGLDFLADYTTRLGRSDTLKFDAAVNFNSTDVTRVGTDGNGNLLLNAQQKAFLSTSFPKNKAIVGVNWTHGAWNFGLHETRYGEVTSQLTYYSGPYANSVTQFRAFPQPARYTTDVVIGWQATPKLRLTAGGNNLFNAMPREIPAENQYLGVWKYDWYVQQIGFNGGYYYFRLNLDL